MSSKRFNTVAELKLAKLKVNDLVETKGYYAAGDGGGATYLIVAPQAADEYGDHTLANGNVALLQQSGDINVKQYGATGDGSTDDYTAIQVAFDTGLGVFFPTGTYRSETELIINNRNTSLKMELGGDDDAVTSIDSRNSIGFGIRFPVDGASGWDGDIDGVYWENVRVTMNGTGSGAVDWGQVSFGTAINCTFTAAGAIGQKALRVRGDDLGSGAYYNTFIGCSMGCSGTAFKSAGSFAVELFESAGGATPNSNTFISCRITGGEVGARITGNNNAFYSPYFESNGSKAIEFRAGGSNRCLDNIVMNPRVEGSLTTAVIEFAVLARTSRVYGGHLTSFSPAVLVNDVSDGSNSWDLNAQVHRGNTLDDFNLDNLVQFTTSEAAVVADKITMDADKMWFLTGTGSPEGSVDAPKGSLWTNQAASSGSTLLYMKTTALGTLTGWVANTP